MGQGKWGKGKGRGTWERLKRTALGRDRREHTGKRQYRQHMEETEKNSIWERQKRTAHKRDSRSQHIARQNKQHIRMTHRRNRREKHTGEA
jgi:hypothetical protein